MHSTSQKLAISGVFADSGHIPATLARKSLLLLFRKAEWFALNQTTFLLLERIMLSWALTFLVVALIAGVLGFGVIAGTAASIAKICFVVFLVLFVIGLLMGRRRRIV